MGHIKGEEVRGYKFEDGIVYWEEYGALTILARNWTVTCCTFGYQIVTLGGREKTVTI